MNDFDNIFSYAKVNSGLTEMLTKERAFRQSDFPVLADLYDRTIDKNELEWLTAKSKKHHGNLENLKSTKTRILSENLYPKSTQFFNEKLLIGLRFTSLLCDIFGNNKVFSDHLEVAAGTALASYSMKCMGIIKNSDANDILFRGDDCKDPKAQFDQLIKLISRRHDYMQMINASAHGFISGETEPTSFTTSCLSDRFYNFIDNNNRDYNYKPFDKYYAEDFLTTEFEKKYDLITIYAGINYFDNKDFFKKITKITKPGAVILCINDYFYDAGGGGMGLPIHMPWLHTLFSKEDLISLYEKYFSSEAAEFLSLAYYYPNTHINQSTQEENATKEGFKKVFSRRTSSNDLPFLGQHAYRIKPLYRFFSEFRPDLNVTSADFRTYYNTQIFVKE